MTTNDTTLANDLDILSMHTCCYSNAEISALLSRVRRQAVLQAADYFAATHARVGGETYPDDLREYADRTYGGQP